MVKSGPPHHWSGARHRLGTAPADPRFGGRPRREPVPECYRCTEVRRKLTSIRIVAGGTTLGSALLCGECISELIPLDPDPLHVDGDLTATA